MEYKIKMMQLCFPEWKDTCTKNNLTLSLRTSCVVHNHAPLRTPEDKLYSHVFVLRIDGVDIYSCLIDRGTYVTDTWRKEVQKHYDFWVRANVLNFCEVVDEVSG